MLSFSEFMSNQSKKPIDEGFKKDVDQAVNNLIEEAIEEKNSEIVTSVTEKTETSIDKDHKKEELNESVEVAPSGYKIFRDKAEILTCDMEISGANLTTSKARIIVEGKNLTYMFEGSIDAQGKCKIPLKKMNFLNENERGIIKLEIIVDDTVFTPWEDNFVAVDSKKVTAKAFESTEDPTSKIGVRLKNIE